MSAGTTVDLNNLSKEDLEAYIAGRLRLSSRKDGTSRLAPSAPRINDRNVTDAAKRAYSRVWYLKNRTKRRAYTRDWHARKLAKLAKAGNVKPNASVSVAPDALDAKKLKRKEYIAGWRARNKDRIIAYNIGRRAGSPGVVKQLSGREKKLEYQRRYRAKLVAKGLTTNGLRRIRGQISSPQPQPVSQAVPVRTLSYEKRSWLQQVIGSLFRI